MLVPRLFTHYLYRVSTYRVLIRILLIILYIVGLLLFFGLFVVAGQEDEQSVFHSRRPPRIKLTEDQALAQSESQKKGAPAVIDLLPGTDLETMARKSTTPEERQAVKDDYKQLSDTTKSAIRRGFKVVHKNFFKSADTQE